MRSTKPILGKIVSAVEQEPASDVESGCDRIAARRRCKRRSREGIPLAGDGCRRRNAVGVADVAGKRRGFEARRARKWSGAAFDGEPAAGGASDPSHGGGLGPPQARGGNASANARSPRVRSPSSPFRRSAAPEAQLRQCLLGRRARPIQVEDRVPGCSVGLAHCGAASERRLREKSVPSLTCAAPARAPPREDEVEDNPYQR